MSIEQEDERIILSEELQIKILKFFLKTSIPRAKKMRELSDLSEKEGNSEK